MCPGPYNLNLTVLWNNRKILYVFIWWQLIKKGGKLLCVPRTVGLFSTCPAEFIYLFPTSHLRNSCNIILLSSIPDYIDVQDFIPICIFFCYPLYSILLIFKILFQFAYSFVILFTRFYWDLTPIYNKSIAPRVRIMPWVSASGKY